MTTITLPAALTPTAALNKYGFTFQLPTGPEDDKFITTLARHPDMHCLRFSMYVEAVIADNEAADALRFDIE